MCIYLRFNKRVRGEYGQFWAVIVNLCGNNLVWVLSLTASSTIVNIFVVLVGHVVDLSRLVIH